MGPDPVFLFYKFRIIFPTSLSCLLKIYRQTENIQTSFKIKILYKVWIRIRCFHELGPDPWFSQAWLKPDRWNKSSGSTARRKGKHVIMAANSLRQGQTKLPHSADHHHATVIEEICKEYVAEQTFIGWTQFRGVRGRSCQLWAKRCLIAGLPSFRPYC